MAGGTDYHEKAAHDEGVTKAVWRHLRALTWLQWACPGAVAAAVAEAVAAPARSVAPLAVSRGLGTQMAGGYSGRTRLEKRTKLRSENIVLKSKH